MKVFVVIFALSLSLGLAKKCSIDFDCPSIQKCEAGSCVEENNPESCNKRSDCLRSDYGYACVKVCLFACSVGWYQLLHFIGKLWLFHHQPRLSCRDLLHQEKVFDFREVLPDRNTMQEQQPGS